MTHKKMVHSVGVIYCISLYSGIQTLTFLFFVTFFIHCYIWFTLLWLSDDFYLSVTTFSILCTFKLWPLHICHLLPSFYIWGQCYCCTPCSLVTFAIFLTSIHLPLCYLTTFLLAYTSPYSLTIDLCALLVFKQPVLIVSPQFESQPRLPPLTFWLNWSSWPSSIFTFILLPCHTPVTMSHTVAQKTIPMFGHLV